MVSYLPLAMAAKQQMLCLPEEGSSLLCNVTPFLHLHLHGAANHLPPLGDHCCWDTIPGVSVSFNAKQLPGLLLRLSSVSGEKDRDGPRGVSAVSTCFLFGWQGHGEHSQLRICDTHQLATGAGWSNMVS